MRRARRRIGTAVVSAAAVVALGFAFSCRGPTQIKLVISTDVPCSRLKGVAITAGPYAYVEDGAPATITNECVDGKIGSQTSEAIKQFQRSRGVTADGYADTRLLALLRS